MRRFSATELLFVALAAVALLLVAIVAWQIATNGANEGTVSAVAFEGAEVPDMPSPLALSLEDYSEIAERPLFSPTRRPSRGAVAPQIAAPSTRQSFDFELVGLVKSDKRNLALIRPRGSRETLQLGEGEVYRGWTIVEIGTAHVVVRSSDAEHRVELNFKPR